MSDFPWGILLSLVPFRRSLEWLHTGAFSSFLERDGARRPAKPAATVTGSSGEGRSNAEYVSYLKAELKQTGVELKVLAPRGNRLFFFPVRRGQECSTTLACSPHGLLTFDISCLNSALTDSVAHPPTHRRCARS